MVMTSTAEEAREALRKEHGVRLVNSGEEGFAADQLPDGVYGFTSSPALASPLFASRQYRNFEVHRLPGGTTSVVGFVTSQEASQLTRRSNDAVPVLLYPDAEGEATAIVSLPYNEVVQHRQYSVRNTAAISLQVVARGRLLHI